MRLNKDRLLFFVPFAIVIAAIVLCLLFAVIKIGSFYRYANIIKKSADRYGLDPGTVAAVIKAESNFDKNAVSQKGATGLMQLLPETAEYIAEKIGYTEKINLKSAECNIELGCAYLAYLFEKFTTEREVLCAYNAGEGRVTAWLSDKAYSSDGRTLEYIPFSETREYVVSIEKYKREYSAVFSRRNKSCSEQKGQAINYGGDDNEQKERQFI